MEIAFLGLGTMGSPMAQNLVKGGYAVQGWNRTPHKPLVQSAMAAGVNVVPRLAAAVADATVIMTCVGDETDVMEVILGENGVIHHCPPQSLIIDFSTIGPATAQALAQHLEAHGHRFLDAPISGGDIGAQQGTLTIMVGGQNGDFTQALPLFEVLGRKIVHCGPVGSGQAVKLCNQALCGLQAIATAEALQLAQGLGIDPNLVIDVCSTGAAGSWALANLGPKMVQNDWEPGFMVQHLLKDLRLVRAEEDGLPGVNLADRLFKILGEQGGMTQGTQAIFRRYLEDI